MVSTVIKNWDKENWLSSKNYILKFNKFLLKVNKLDSSSKILDIGCGRGKIIGALSSKLKLKEVDFYCLFLFFNSLAIDFLKLELVLDSYKSIIR